MENEEGTEVQTESEALTGQLEEGNQPASTNSQGLIAKYLDGVDPQIRHVVADRLEKARHDWDSNANKKIQAQAEQLKGYKALGDPESLEFTVQLYHALVESPVDTIKYVIDRFQEEQGVDLKADIMSMLTPQENIQNSSTQATEDESQKTFTKAELEAYLEEKLQAYAENQQVRQQESAEQESARQQAMDWLNESADKHHLKLNTGDIRYLTYQAHALLENGEADDGQTAIEMAVSALADRLKPATSEKKPIPRVPTGGSGVPPKQFNASNPAERKALALQMLQSIQDN